MLKGISLFRENGHFQQDRAVGLVFSVGWFGVLFFFFPRDSSVLAWFHMGTVSHFLLSLISLEHCALGSKHRELWTWLWIGLIERPCTILIFKGSEFYPFPLLQDAREYLCHTETCMPAVRESSVPQRIFFSLGTDACEPPSGFPGGVIALLHFCYRLQQPLRIG